MLLKKDLDGTAPKQTRKDAKEGDGGTIVTGWQGAHHLRTQSPSFPNLTVWFCSTSPSGKGGSISTLAPLMTPRFLCFLGLFATVSMKSIMQPFCSIWNTLPFGSENHLPPSSAQPLLETSESSSACRPRSCARLRAPLGRPSASSSSMSASWATALTAPAVTSKYALWPWVFNSCTSAAWAPALTAPTVTSMYALWPWASISSMSASAAESTAPARRKADAVSASVQTRAIDVVQC